MFSRNVSSSVKFFVASALGLLTSAAFIHTAGETAGVQVFNKTFSVSPETSRLEVVNQTGAIKVSAPNPSASKITINARQADGDARVDATQSSEGNVKVEVSGRGITDFEISVPPSTTLDLLTYKGAISVADLTGSVRARITTEGNIQFTGLRSPKVEASSTGGNVIFNGELLPDGDYQLKSLSGKVDVTFPSNADFKLSASSHSGVIDLGGFPMKFERQSNQLVEAAYGAGRAKVFLWTQEGSIHLHRKP
jgi:DUF4097 and DUF4098 domain-containing protein YvlB